MVGWQDSMFRVTKHACALTGRVALPAAHWRPDWKRVFAARTVPFGGSAPLLEQAKRSMTKAIKRSEVIHIRLTQEERARFSALCGPDNLPVSEAVRRLMREATGLGPTFEGEVAEKIGVLTQLLEAAGVELSEAVRAINIGKAPDAAAMRATFEGFAETLWEIESFYRSLCAVARERRRAPETAA